MIAWVGDAELQAIKRRTKARLDRARAQGKTLRRPWSAHTGFILRFNRVDFQGGGGGGKHFYHRPLYHRPGSADLRTRSASPHWTVSLAGSSLDRWAYFDDRQNHLRIVAGDSVGLFWTIASTPEPDLAGREHHLPDVTGKRPLVARFGGIPLKRNRQAVLTDQKPQRYRVERNELINWDALPQSPL